MAAGLRKAGRPIHYTSAVIATAWLMIRSAEERTVVLTTIGGGGRTLLAYGVI